MQSHICEFESQVAAVIIQLNEHEFQVTELTDELELTKMVILCTCTLLLYIIYTLTSSNHYSTEP